MPVRRAGFPRTSVRIQQHCMRGEILMTENNCLPPRGAGCLAVDLAKGGSRLLEEPGAGLDVLGGRGLGVALLATMGDPALPPLDPRQPFVLAAGPLTGTGAPSSGRVAAVGVSPLTGTIFDSNAGGRFAARLRAAGLSALLVSGRCPEWSVLVVDGRRSEGADGVRVSLRCLAELWPEARPDDASLTSSRVVSGLRAALGNAFSFVFPSVAGRRGALLSCLRTDDGRSLGRGGLGLQLASRRLFAVAVAGEGMVQPRQRERFGFLVYEAGKLLEANPVTSRALPQFGTAMLVQLLNQEGVLPACNFRASHWPGAQAISGERLRDTQVTGRKGCFGCRIRCTGRMGAGASTTTAPEYETLWALGADCGIDDLEAVQAANILCGELGLDTISAGATIACAMELSAEGALGRTIRFGDTAYMLRLVGEMGRVEGFGESLARGSARFAAEWGYPHLSMQVKGLELPGYDPRGMQGQGLGYATSNRGGCHLRGNMLGPEILGIPKLIDRFATVGKSGVLVNLQHLGAVFDSVGMCKFAGFAFGEEVVARLLSAAGGVDLSAQELLRAGERIWNLERLWNLAAGFARKDDTLPLRLLEETLSEGPAAGRVVELGPMLQEYYRARSWSAEGVPSGEKVRGLGLEAVALRLSGRGAEQRRSPAGEEGRRHLRAV